MNGMSSLTSETKESDVLKALLEESFVMGLNLTKITETTTDGPPSMIGGKSGLVSKLKECLQAKKHTYQGINVVLFYIKRPSVQNYWNLKTY